MLEGLIRQLGGKYALRLADNDSEISTSMDTDVAVVVLTHVSYRTGRMLDMAKHTQLAHEAYDALCVPHAENKLGLPSHNMPRLSAWRFPVCPGYAPPYLLKGQHRSLTDRMHAV